ncbi:glycosyltransferase family 2 protein [Calothrix rhizosoleniae]|uniref:glycosyltransferase family 2 protein n=1 Tax=Calothrix rhizosoleniae TaxID=888997 RepID=UPI000B4A14BC|nr:glycosyltransferase family 2 protein [Calothrix rhizosoleniae]
MEPLVSVVIPTYHQSLFTKRAVESALTQTLSQIEVIVVIDGSYKETHTKLTTINDSRLKIIKLSLNQSYRAARNAGVNAARARWIAFLDDNDEWMPYKLELQLETAQNSGYKFPIIPSVAIAWTPQGDIICPRRLPKQSEPLSEYLFVRNTSLPGKGLIHTSTILTSKELLQRVKFDTTLQRHDDWDWLLRANNQEGAGIEFVQQVLSVWNLGDNRTNLHKSRNWQVSFNWIQGKRGLVTPRAYSSFILAEVSARAVLAREWKSFLPILWESIRFGKPQIEEIILYFGMWFMNPQERNWLRNLLFNNNRKLAT